MSSNKIPLYSNQYFGMCAIGGILSCGLTHTAVTPLDVVKCNMQANPKEFTGIGQGFGKVFREGGVGGLFRGWVPTLLGYSVQGMFKFGLYEFFKYKYSKAFDEQTAYKYRDFIYLGASASGEFFADIGLCAFEAVKVRVQTSQNFAKGLSDGLPKIIQSEGVGGLFKGLGPLWGRQIPYTMMKFIGFERAVEFIYKNFKPKEKCSKLEQLGVSFAGGYIAGVFCAVISHPADNIVSILNKDKTQTIGSIVKNTSAVDLFTKGLTLRIIMIGTLTGLQWLIYDSFKVQVGLPTTGGAKPATPAASAPAAGTPAKH